MEEKKPTNPLKVSLVFGRDEWTQAQRQMFMDAFSQSVERQAIQLWTGTLRRLPRGLAYKIEDTESNLNMLKLSFAPGFEGVPLRLSAHINLPETIRAHQKVEFQEEVERTHEKIEKDWVIRYLLPVIGWVLQITDRETKIEEVKRDFIKDVDEKIDERSREKSQRVLGWSCIGTGFILSGARLGGCDQYPGDSGRAGASHHAGGQWQERHAFTFRIAAFCRVAR